MVVAGAFGLTDEDVVVVPDADDAASTETIPAVEEDPGFATDTGAPRRQGLTGPHGGDPHGPYQLPPLDLLRTAPPSNADSRAERDTLAALERTLHTFGVDAQVVGAHRGPTVTMYEVAVARARR